MLEMRELERKDLPIINAWRRDAELISRLGAPYRFIGPEIDDVWFDTYLKSRGSSIRCVTFDSEKQQLPLCLVSLTGIDWVARSATLHLMIGDAAARGKGVGTWSVRRMLSHAFLDQGLHRVELSVLADNEVAIHVYEKCGFTLEGRRREACFKHGTWVDMMTYSMLEREWREFSQTWE